MRRISAGLVAVIMMLGCFSWLGTAGGEAAAAGSGRQFVAEISVKQFAAGEAVVNLLIADGLDGTEPDIRFYPFDAETGLYATGEGEPAGDRAEASVSEGQDRVVTVSLKAAGKYSLYGIPFYVLSPENEETAALVQEILDAADKAEGKTQKATAEKLYAWLLKRVKNVMPEDRPELQEACADPFNCLLTGYALPETYAPLYQLLLRCAGIRSIPVYGTAAEAEHGWVMCRLDGEWVYADPAMDDVKDKAGKKYFTPEDKQFRKDHALSEASEQLVNERINGTALDAFLAEDREILDVLMRKDSVYDAQTTIFSVEGKRYGLCPTEPVTIHCYSDYHSDEPWPAGELFRARSFLGVYEPWDSEYQRFLRADGIFGNMPEDAIELVDYAPDFSSITVRFLVPGAYNLNGTEDWFFALDPDNEDQAAAAAQLDEALETCRRDMETETAKALHDWIRKKISYDYGNYNKKKRQEDVGYDDSSQCPIHGVLAGKLVCGGYTHLYDLLLNSAGIPSYTVGGRRTSGADMTHAWNIHRLDGVWSYTDVTWDDELGSYKYFAKDYGTMSKDHIPAYSGEAFMNFWGRNRIYDAQLLQFFRDWGPKDIVPEALKVLPATAKDCGFPAVTPDFWKVRITMEDGVFWMQHPGRSVNCYQLLLLDKNGKKPSGTGGYNSEGMKKFPHEFILSKSDKPRFLRLTLQDYQEDMRPTGKASYRQIVEWTNKGEIVNSEYNYQVPMKKNEFKGFGEGSCHIFTYDMDLNRISRTWHLEGEEVTLDVTVCFDSEGKTVRYRVTRTPTGGDAVTWEAEADGAITYLSYEKDRTLRSLADLTEKYSDTRYEAFRNKLSTHYSDYIKVNAPPEDGVRVYALSLSVDEAYRGRKAIATKDPLFRWNEQGQLEYNPDAVDLDGKEIQYNEFEPDLSVCERLRIGE